MTHPRILRISGIVILVALVLSGLWWHFGTSTSLADRRIEVEGLSFFIPAGITVSFDAEYPDRTTPSRSRSWSQRALRATHVDLDGGFLLVEPSAWRPGAGSAIKSAAALFGKLESSAQREYKPIGAPSSPQVFQVGELPAYGSTWMLHDGSKFTCAYAVAKRDLYVVLIKLPDSSKDPKKRRAYLKLQEVIRSMKAKSSR